MSDTGAPWVLAACHQLGASLGLAHCRTLGRRLRDKLDTSLSGRRRRRRRQAQPREGATEKMRLLPPPPPPPSQMPASSGSDAPASSSSSSAAQPPQLSLREEERLFYDFDLSPDSDDLVSRRQPDKGSGEDDDEGFVMGPVCTRQPRPTLPWGANWQRGALEQGRPPPHMHHDGTIWPSAADTVPDGDDDDHEVFSECRESTDNDDEDEDDSWKEALPDINGTMTFITEDARIHCDQSPAPQENGTAAEGKTDHEEARKGDDKWGRNDTSDHEVIPEAPLQSSPSIRLSSGVVERLAAMVEDEISAAIRTSSKLPSASTQVETREDAGEVRRTEFTIPEWTPPTEDSAIISESTPAAEETASYRKGQQQPMIVDSAITSDTTKESTPTNDITQFLMPECTPSTKGSAISDESTPATEKTAPEPQEQEEPALEVADVFAFLNASDNSGQSEPQSKDEEEDEEDDEDDEDDEVFLSSPTSWGMLKQIDRFQVRKMVKDAEEESSDSNGQDSNGDLSSPAPEECTSPLPHVVIPEALLSEDKERTRKISRSSSLKTTRTPPGTPALKKIVRFADVMGLDLEDVRHVFLEDLPMVPASAYDDLDTQEVPSADNDDRPEPPRSASTTEPVPVPRPRAPTKTLIAMFALPGEDVLTRVRSQHVCLENAHFSESAVRGHIRVLNMAFHKAVHVRYTLDEWRSFFDLEAVYLPQSTQDGGETERFAFCIFGGDALDIGQRLVFCVRYRIDDQREFWDNNHGNNYFFQCIQESAPLPPSPVDTWIHFV